MTFVTDYTEAERAYESARRQWNALPTPEDRRASGIELDPLRVLRDTAAQALLVDASGRHKIEERSVVYLVLAADGAWTVDGATYGDPLEGYPDGPLNEACEHDDGLDEECEALKSAAATSDLPTAVRLIDLFAADARPDFDELDAAVAFVRRTHNGDDGDDFDSDQEVGALEAALNIALSLLGRPAL
jgi:hypothetical protein